ncbi:MAG: S8 family serine peptidase [Ignavibacteriaceae bacterium]|nr:S8 family serine peptidase [Ignavibacteriaceae bacterium]
MNKFFSSFITSLLLVFAAVTVNAQYQHPKIDSYLQNVLKSSNGNTVRVYAVLKDRLSLNDLKSMTFNLKRKERQKTVVNILKDYAAGSQQRLLSFLNNNAEGGAVTYVKSIWAINVIAFHAKADAIMEAAQNFEEIGMIYYDPQYDINQLTDDNGITKYNEDNNLYTPSPMAIQPGLTLINVPQVWAMGDSGKGVVVGNFDSGADWTHPDLAPNIWNNLGEDFDGDGHTMEWNGSTWIFDPGDVNNIDDDNNGFVDDFIGWDYENNDNNPSEGSSHGTATTGIVVGNGTNGTQTGVAPRAKIIILKPSGESDYWLAQQYAMDKGADVVTSSLSYKWYFSPQPNYPMFRQMTDMELAAGIVHTNSTSNDGGNSSAPVPFNISAPGNCPGPWVHPDQTLVGGLSSVIGSANVDAGSDNIVSSSPYGPFPWEDFQVNHSSYPYSMPVPYRDYPYETVPGSMGLIKPDIAAPGNGTTSTAPGGGYQSFSGTSGATPHLGGVAALLLSVNPNLEPAAVSMIMQTTAIERGVPGKDNRYGAGRVDAFQAFLLAAGNQDDTPPSQIIDLAVVEAGSNWLKLNWTAPHDSSVGGVATYDVRMSTSPISDSVTFYTAQAVAYPGSPDTAGAPQQLLINNLTFGTSYYFAIRSGDIWGNLSPISNTPTGSTYGAPVVSTNKASVTHTLTTGTTAVDTVTLSNVSVGNSTLDFSVSLENNTFPTGVVGYRLVPKKDLNENISVNKDDSDTKGGLSLEGQGGPDAFGYKWIDSNEPNGPQYVWNDISSTGTLASTWTPTGTFDPKDEGYAGPFNLGFNFKFYGETKTEVYVNSNGPLLFTAPTANMFSNVQIPTASAPNGLICAFWDDLDGRTQGTVHYQQVGNTFVIQFTNWQKYSATGSLTFQYVIYSGGKIMIYYQAMNATLNSATVGIESPSGTVGLQVAYNAAYVANNLALQFAAEPDWLSNNVTSGTLYNGSSVDVELLFDTQDFIVGNYSMDVVINSNDPVTTTLTIPVNMEIVAIPVELTSLSADINRSDVTLHWSTATETNNKGFRVERQSSTIDGQWEELSFVNGKGTTTELSRYTFTDENLPMGKYTYRLKQVDFDGTFDYSPAVNVTVEAPKDYALHQNYPNPFNPSTTIEFTLPEKAEVVLELYNMLGEKVTQLINGTIEAGYRKFKLDASGFTSGTYIYRLTAKGSGKTFMDVKKMLLIK